MVSSGLAEITIDGKKIGLRFGLPCIRYLVEKSEALDLMNGKFYNELGMAHILYGGYVNACLARDTVTEIPFSVIYEAIEKMWLADTPWPEEIVQAIRTFENSRTVDTGIKLNEAKKALTEKKNQSNGTESSPLPTEASA